MKPVCPKCGTIKVEKVGKSGRCLESDCGHQATWQAFGGFGPGTIREPNQKWRDPVAMSMDGYDE